MTYCNGETSVIRPDLASPGAYLILSLCTMSWSSVTSGKWPSWSVSKCSRSWRHRSQKPRVRPCEPLCGLIRGGAASLPWRGIQSLFRADFCGLPRLCGGRRKRQEKGIGAFLRQRRSRQPAVRTATRVCGVLRLTLIIGPRMYFGAILCKKARQPRVYKAFGGRRHTEGRCSSMDENGKSRHSVWLSDDVWQEVDAFYKLDNCPIRNEFV